MAAIGDSITQASMTCSLLLMCPAGSWATGTSSTVQSHAVRLRATAPVTAYNNAVPGAVAAELPAQATRAASQGAQYVTMQIGANDACADTVALMTPTADFAASVQTTLATLAASPAQPEIFVASIPNLKRLWELNKSSFSARLAWAAFRQCDSMLLRPTSTAAADVIRRDAVQTRVDEYNAALAAACAATAKCRWDGYAVANYAFTRSDVSTRDYFHPSTTGQRSLAAVTWAASQWVG
ncbi:GDSL-type esterase/lipase family protein [Microbacterium hominis]|uniref:SGNH/GDSL hydrolase family protein n=1 Tax=Microbacterium hominis TaxID=162426 RepID=A0A7D4UIH9_9MICO|nr:GDSL-type esterase/lipase family protein [Microbacterium hominis]QKJ18487.1 SGNH/GDSL hydrolase family protein [Microbacterium hominis]